MSLDFRPSVSAKPPCRSFAELNFYFPNLVKYPFILHSISKINKKPAPQKFKGRVDSRYHPCCMIMPLGVVNDAATVFFRVVPKEETPDCNSSANVFRLPPPAGSLKKGFAQLLRSFNVLNIWLLSIRTIFVIQMQYTVQKFLFNWFYCCAIMDLVQGEVLKSGL